jgi:alkanesulfonate monooxygenase SsuD/methylene tetrahydromethanopterin reductase-like flavin-dependent oxidoreductase (luciferase family)
MCAGYDRSATVDWCRLADLGPFSSISCGERMTFHNPDMWVTLAAAAALTERLRILVSLSVLPAHASALVAKQVATLDVLSAGRVTLGVGVGGREHDYRALNSGFGRRHVRLDAGVRELREMWAGTPPFDGADPIGPPCVQQGGPPILAGALGPKAMAATTITTFEPDAVNRAIDAAEAAGVDEFVLVPGATDLGVLEATIDLLASR